MIRVKQSRDRNGEHFEQPTLTFTDPLEAMYHLAKVELGWNGHVTEVNKNKIKVETHVLDCFDTSIFEGPVDEMYPLLMLIYYYIEATQKYSDMMLDRAIEEIDRIRNHIGFPLLFTLASPLLMGGNRLKVAVMLACGIHDNDEIKAGLYTDVEDLIAAVQMQNEGLCTFREALVL